MTSFVLLTTFVFGLETFFVLVLVTFFFVLAIFGMSKFECEAVYSAKYGCQATLIIVNIYLWMF